MSTIELGEKYNCSPTTILNRLKDNRSKLKPQLCKCGCGNYTEPGREFMNKHKSSKPKPEPQLCECGCGEYAKPGNKFIDGHAWIGRKHSDETLKKQRDVQLERYKDPLEHEKNRLGQLKRYEEPEQREAARERAIKQFKDPKNREKQKIAGLKRWENTKEREKQRERANKQWKDPGQREKFIDASNNYWNDPESHEKASAAQQRIPYDEWEDFAAEKLYCPDFNEKCKESNRDKYNRLCFLTGLPESENITKDNKRQKLSVHHVDMDKGQGCNGKKWKLVPLCKSWHHKVHNKLWEARIIWLLDNVW